MTEYKCPNTATELALGRMKTHLCKHSNIYVGISGGSDSDIMLDMIERIVKDEPQLRRRIHYVFWNTGIEYQATKKHLVELEKKYNITIDKRYSKVPVPLGCKKYGQPFISKYASEMIERLQSHNFDFANHGNKSYEELMELYPNCKVALEWWCNKGGKGSRFNINRFFALKEFMIENPPNFKISNKCCKGAKKDNGHDYITENGCDLMILGLRKAEDGIRSTNIQTCFTADEDGGCDSFRPLWWFSDQEKQEYKEFFEIKYSDCYEVYGMIRTGCATCVYGSRWEQELQIVKENNTKLYTAVSNIFADTYAYTRAYREYANRKKQGICEGQMTIFDLLGE